MLDWFSRRRRLRRAFARRAPWITRFEIDGEAYGGHFDSGADPRPEVFFQHFPQARRILELGCQEGGHTYKLASRPGVERVVALEGRPASAEPWRLLEQIASVAPGLYLWTHYAADDRVDTEVAGYRGLTWREGGLADPLAGLSPTSFWPVLEDLVTMVRRSGLTRIDVLETQPDQPDGPATLLVARSA